MLIHFLFFTGHLKQINTLGGAFFTSKTPEKRVNKKANYVVYRPSVPPQSG